MRNPLLKYPYKTLFAHCMENTVFCVFAVLEDLGLSLEFQTLHRHLDGTMYRGQVAPQAGARGSIEPVPASRRKTGSTWTLRQVRIPAIPRTRAVHAI